MLDLIQRKQLAAWQDSPPLPLLTSYLEGNHVFELEERKVPEPICSPSIVSDLCV